MCSRKYRKINFRTFQKKEEATNEQAAPFTPHDIPDDNQKSNTVDSNKPTPSSNDHDEINTMIKKIKENSTSIQNLDPVTPTEQVMKQQ